jgi:hypothetical protein
LCRGGGQDGARCHEFEVTVRDGVLVFLAEEPLLDQDIHRRRVGAAILPLEERNGPSVLLTAKNQLGFLLATSRRLPGGHGRAHHDRHDAHRDEQRDHGVPEFIRWRLARSFHIRHQSE